MDEWPPLGISPDETAAERSIRVEAEMSAKKVSEEIDHAIELERFERRKRKPATKILLLGECSRFNVGAARGLTINAVHFLVPRSGGVG